MRTSPVREAAGGRDLRPLLPSGWIHAMILHLPRSSQLPPEHQYQTTRQRPHHGALHSSDNTHLFLKFSNSQLPSVAGYAASQATWLPLQTQSFPCRPNLEIANSSPAHHSPHPSLSHANSCNQHTYHTHTNPTSHRNNRIDYHEAINHQHTPPTDLSPRGYPAWVCDLSAEQTETRSPPWTPQSVPWPSTRP
jgi:hypothetical protein